MADNELTIYDDLYKEIKETLLASRQQAYAAINFAMVQAYWQIGRIIVEREKAGDFHLGSRVPEFEFLASRLSAEFGKGFSVRTLYQMRKFYVLFPSLNALRSQLTWTHYRLLSLLREKTPASISGEMNYGISHIPFA